MVARLNDLCPFDLFILTFNSLFHVWIINSWIIKTSFSILISILLYWLFNFFLHKISRAKLSNIGSLNLLFFSQKQGQMPSKQNIFSLNLTFFFIYNQYIDLNIYYYQVVPGQQIFSILYFFKMFVPKNIYII